MQDIGSYIRIWAKKIKAIKILGKKCTKCGDDNIFHLDFHHKSDKKYEVSKLWDYRWSDIKTEILKCELLCANCHGALHSGSGRNHEIKKAFINDHNLTKCENCGYDKNIGSLDFHHIKDKFFVINKAFMRQVKVTPQELLTEVNKCKILCRNCHREEHFDFMKYKTYEKQILEKVENLREIQPKIDRQEVKEMIDSGMKQIEIARYFNASKGTISGIVKEFKM